MGPLDLTILAAVADFYQRHLTVERTCCSRLRGCRPGVMARPRQSRLEVAQCSQIWWPEWAKATNPKIRLKLAPMKPTRGSRTAFKCMTPRLRGYTPYRSIGKLPCSSAEKAP